MDEFRLRKHHRKIADLTTAMEISHKLVEAKRALMAAAIMRRDDQETETTRQELMAAMEATLDKEIALRRYIADVGYQEYR